MDANAASDQGLASTQEPTQQPIEQQPGEALLPPAEGEPILGSGISNAAISDQLPPVPIPDLETSLAASADALKFTSSLDLSIWRYISYNDQLSVLTQKPRELEAGLMPVGHYSLTVEPLWYMDCDCYKIHGEMKYELQDFTSQFTLTTYVTPMLRTIQENKVLTYRTKQQIIERKADLLIIGDVIGHVNSAASYNMTYSCVLTTPHAYQAGQHVPEVHKSVLNAPAGFLSEGASLMLDRIITRRLANKSLTEDGLSRISFVILTPTTDGTDDIIKPPQVGPPLPAFLSLLSPPKPPSKKWLSLASLSYSILPTRQITVKESETSNVDANLEVIGFERLIQPVQRDVLPIVTFSYHLRDGHLAVQLQAGCPVQLQLSLAPLIVPEDEFLKQPTFQRQELDWENDAQLQAVFEERTDELKNEFLSFIRHKPELRSLLADFLQALLLRKPENVIAFAAQYFSAFGSSRALSSEVASS